MKKVRLRKWVKIAGALFVALFVICSFIPAQADNEGLDISEYIKDAVVQYRESSTGSWNNVDADTFIPSDASLRFTVSYGNVPVDQVKSHNNTIQYQLTNAAFLREFSGEDATISDGNTVVGNITRDADNKVVKVTFHQDYLDKYTTLNSGSFNFTAKADASVIDQQPSQTVKIGNKECTLNFEPNAIAKTGELIVNKGTPTYESDGQTGYLKYTVTVSTENDPMPGVRIEDYFSQNSQFIDHYVGISNTALTLSSNPSGGDRTPCETRTDGTTAGNVILNGDSRHMVWNIGDMAANETRKLTYWVQLGNNYNGKHNEGNITNTATPYSHAGDKDYAHNPSSSTFSPNVNVSTSKNVGETTTETEGDTVYTVFPYTITVTADANNTWSLRNLKVNDNLSGSMSQSDLHAAGAKYTDFHIYKGTGTSGEEVNIKTDGTNPRNCLYDSTNPSASGRMSFDLYLDDLAPGQSRTIIYNVKIPQSYIEQRIVNAGNGEVKLSNSEGIYSDDTSGMGGQSGMASSTSSKQLSNKTWVSKVQAANKTSGVSQAVGSGETVYSLQNSAWTADSSASHNIEIPDGSLIYTVRVNDDNIWDVSSTQFSDSFSKDAAGNAHLAYTGYLKVDYYSDGSISGTPTKTVWLNIDNSDSFSFTPASVDNTLGKGAYQLSYYAKPANTSSQTGALSVTNNFKLNGSVIGPGGGGYGIPGNGMQASTTTTVEGGNQFSGAKNGWYFDPSTKTAPFTNGKLYWVIDCTGNTIPAGMQLRDRPASNNTIVDGSLVGLFKGTPSAGASFTSAYANVEAVQKDSAVTSVDSSAYTAKTSDNSLIITINDSIQLNAGEHLYIIVATNPKINWSSVDLRSAQTFQNFFSYKDINAANFGNEVTATQNAYRSGSNFKEGGSIVVRDESGNWSKVTDLRDGNGVNKIPESVRNGTAQLQNGTTLIHESGVYIDWRIKVNYIGDEEGTVHVTDLIPEGQVPVYVRYFWIDPAIYNNAPTMPVLDDLGEGWTNIGLTNTVIDGNNVTYSNEANAYYNASTNTIRFDVGNLRKGTKVDANSLEVQVVTKVTDSDALIGNVTKTYTNRVQVRDDNNTLLTDWTADYSRTFPKTVDKSDATIKNGRVPFTINVNQNGLNLSADQDVLTLVDDLKDPLDYESTSLLVKDKSGNVLDSSQYRYTIETIDGGHRLTLTVPDQKALTITYNAVIRVSPDTPFDINNSAYWYGHQNDGSAVTKSNNHYTIGGSVSGSAYPSLTITKVDADDQSVRLSGANFSVTEVSYNTETNQWEPVTSSQALNGTTNSSGQIAISNSASLEYNKIYAVQETQAPDGYQLNNTVYYVASLKAEADGTYSVDGDQLKARGVSVDYTGNIMLAVTDNKIPTASITVNKVFKDGYGNILTSNIPEGTYRFGLYQGDTLQQILTLNENNGSVTYYLQKNPSSTGNGESVETPSFTGLQNGQTYTVYELDSSGNRIDEYSYESKNTTKLNNTDFEVTYKVGGNTTNTVTLPSSGNASVEITNTEHITVEPPTGIRESADLAWLILFMVMAGGGLYLAVRTLIRNNES